MTRAQTLYSHFQRLPVRTIARIALGIIYFGFGIQKFLPGTDPTEDLIRAVWGGALDPEKLIFGIAAFETAAGGMLILNIGTQRVTGLIVLHVAGTFVTGVLHPSAVISMDAAGIFALTVAGQYILKNLLILSNCLFLFDGDNRAHARRLFRVRGKLYIDGQPAPVTTTDLSEGGVSLHIKEPAQPIWVGKPIQIELQSPLTGQTLQMDCSIANISRTSTGRSQLLRIGVRFKTEELKLWELMPYLSDRPIEPEESRSLRLVPRPEAEPPSKRVA